jgi:galactose mutarotase-like enzyme
MIIRVGLLVHLRSASQRPMVVKCTNHSAFLCMQLMVREKNLAISDTWQNTISDHGDGSSKYSSQATETIGAVSIVTSVSSR